MEGLEQAMLAASHAATSGSWKEAYIMYIRNLAGMIDILRTVVDLGSAESRKICVDGLNEIIPLCRMCLNRLEDILKISAESNGFLASASHFSEGFPEGVPQQPSSAERKFADRRNGSAVASGIPESALNTIVVSPLPPSPFEKRDASSPNRSPSSTLLLPNHISLGTGPFLRAELAPPQPLLSQTASLALRPSVASRSSSAPPSPSLTPGKVFGQSTAQFAPPPAPPPPPLLVDLSGLSRHKSLAPPKVPVSPLHTTFTELNEQLLEKEREALEPTKESVELILPAGDTLIPAFRDGQSPPARNAPVSTSLSLASRSQEAANAVRTKIARVLNQMQLCSTAANLHSFRPIAVAFQLCLIEHKLLRRIHPPDMLTHAPPHRPNAAVQATTDFFNYFTRTVECSILESATPGDRSKVILRWIKVANHLRGFHNYQTLKAVVCALNTPPISRLKRTWPIVKRKPEWNELAEHRTLLSEQSNYYAYREHIKEHQTRPMIPFLGVLIHDLTYLSTIAKRDGVDPSTDRHVQEILKHLRYCSSGPRYSYEMLADADAAMQTSKKSLPFRKRLGGGLSEQGVEELSSLRDLSDEDIGIFIAHWLLTRKWISEKELDELSLLREPKAQAVGVGAPTSTTSASSTRTQHQQHVYQTGGSVFAASSSTQDNSDDILDALSAEIAGSCTTQNSSSSFSGVDSDSFFQSGGRETPVLASGSPSSGVGPLAQGSADPPPIVSNPARVTGHGFWSSMTTSVSVSTSTVQQTSSRSINPFSSNSNPFSFTASAFSSTSAAGPAHIKTPAPAHTPPVSRNEIGQNSRNGTNGSGNGGTNAQPLPSAAASSSTLMGAIRETAFSFVGARATRGTPGGATPISSFAAAASGTKRNSVGVAALGVREANGPDMSFEATTRMSASTARTAAVGLSSVTTATSQSHTSESESFSSAEDQKDIYLGSDGSVGGSNGSSLNLPDNSGSSGIVPERVLIPLQSGQTTGGRKNAVSKEGEESWSMSSLKSVSIDAGLDGSSSNISGVQDVILLSEGAEDADKCLPLVSQEGDKADLNDDSSFFTRPTASVVSYDADGSEESGIPPTELTSRLEAVLKAKGKTGDKPNAASAALARRTSKKRYAYHFRSGSDPTWISALDASVPPSPLGGSSGAGGGSVPRRTSFFGFAFGADKAGAQATGAAVRRTPTSAGASPRTSSSSTIATAPPLDSDQQSGVQSITPGDDSRASSAGSSVFRRESAVESVTPTSAPVSRVGAWAHPKVVQVPSGPAPAPPNRLVRGNGLPPLEIATTPSLPPPPPVVSTNAADGSSSATVEPLSQSLLVYPIKDDTTSVQSFEAQRETSGAASLSRGGSSSDRLARLLGLKPASNSGSGDNQSYIATNVTSGTSSSEPSAGSSTIPRSAAWSARPCPSPPLPHRTNQTVGWTSENKIDN